MNNPLFQSHSASYAQLATENGLSPTEVEHAAQYFGNDFDSLSYALSDMEAADTEGFTFD